MQLQKMGAKSGYANNYHYMQHIISNEMARKKKEAINCKAILNWY